MEMLCSKEPFDIILKILEMLSVKFDYFILIIISFNIKESFYIFSKKFITISSIISFIKNLFFFIGNVLRTRKK
jgi:hypothetical protein